MVYNSSKYTSLRDRGKERERDQEGERERERERARGIGRVIFANTPTTVVNFSRIICYRRAFPLSWIVKMVRQLGLRCLA